MGSGLLFHAQLEGLMVMHGELSIIVLQFTDRLQYLNKKFQRQNLEKTKTPASLFYFLHMQIFCSVKIIEN